MKSLTKAPVNLFYDITPLGRILNRLTSDLRTIDEPMPFILGWVLENICNLTSCILMSLIYFPFLIFLVPVIILPAKLIGKYYMKTSRELSRFRSISFSPILNQFTESLTGKKFIRCFKQTENFILKNQAKINANTEICYSLLACAQWMRLCLGLLTAVMLSALFITIIVFRHSVSGAVVGLTLTYIFPLPNTICNMVESSTMLETMMVSVERLREYTILPKECESDTLTDKKCSDWPIFTTVSFKKVKLRYRPNTPLVLKGLTFDIPAGVRVGITGRTGSGKSSLFLSLLRIVELYSGVISIGGVNIALLGLKILRQAITLIPQDPLVFNGIIKDNLDPFGKHDEKVLKKVLDEVQLKFALDYLVKNSGKNMSIGERQLLSLSRALVSNTKIVLFDEATAGIDMENDKLIQEAIKKKFEGCCVLTIAHRLATIIENDLILVLEDGRLKEMGIPAELMAGESCFKSLASRMK